MRRNSVYSYLTDPSSHALGKEKNAKCTAENIELPTRSNSRLIKYTQDDNLYQARQKHLRPCVGPVAKKVTELNEAPPGKSATSLPWNRLIGNSISQQKPPNPRPVILPRARGSMSYQVQHRRSLISLNETPNLAIVVKTGRPTSATSATIIGRSPRKVAQEGSQWSKPGSRKISSNDIVKSASIKKVDSEEEKSSEAVCSGDYVADAEDATVDDISSYTSDDCGADFEYFSGPGGSMRDAQTQTLISGGTWYQIRDKFPFLKVQKRTESCEVQTTMLHAKRSLSDTSLTRLNRTGMERPSTAPSQFVAKSTTVCKLTTTECCVRPSTCPAKESRQFITGTAEVSKCEQTLCKPTTSSSLFVMKSTELCSITTTSHKQPSEASATNQLCIPEPIEAILTPLKYNKESNRRFTMTRGMALSLAASFLLFLGLLWTGISVSLATHRIVTVYLYPAPTQENQLALSIRRLSNYLGLLAQWVWYQVYY